jgi:raffinose/stachyose/melibiose transport system substrate-binding protein
VTAAAALGLAATACSSGGSATGSGAAKDQSFTYWSMWKQGEPQAKVLQTAIGQFTKDTGIKVNVQWKGRQVAQQLAPTLNTANVPADLIDTSDRFAYAQLQATGQAKDLSPVLGEQVPGEAGHTVGDVIPKSYLGLATTDGTLWQIPYELITTQIWYNAAAQPGVAAQPPATWDDFTALLAKEKAAHGGAGPLALDGDVADYDAYWTYFAVLRELGPGAFGKAAADKSGHSFTDPQFVEALSRVEQLVKAGDFTAGYDSSKFPAVQQAWAAGKSDFLLMGTWAPSETGPFAAPGFSYRSFPLPPTAAGGDISSDISGIGFSIPKKAKHSAAAEQFIAYFLAKSHLAGIAAEAKNITSRPDIPVAPALADAQKTLAAGHVVETLDGVKETDAEWYTKVFCPLNSSFLAGKDSAADFAAKLASGTADYWKSAS